MFLCDVEMIPGWLYRCMIDTFNTAVYLSSSRSLPPAQIFWARPVSEDISTKMYERAKFIQVTPMRENKSILLQYSLDYFYMYTLWWIKPEY